MLENPLRFELEQNYPNPFNSATQFQYQLPKSDQVQLVVFNIKGEQVKMLVHEFQPAGYYNIQFIPNDLTSGIYFFQIQTGGFIETKRMLYLK